MLLSIILALLVLFLLSFLLPIGSTETAHGSAFFSKSNKLLKRHHHGITIDGSRKLSLESSYIHSAILAPSGSGKTTRFCIPTILNLDTSIILSDPKGELFELTAGAMQQKGYHIQVLDFINPRQSMRYNPLLLLKDEMDIKTFANGLYRMANAGTSTDSIWQQGATSLLGIFLRSMKNIPDKKYFNLANLNRLLNQVTDDESKAVPRFIARYASSADKEAYRAFIQQEVKVKLGQLSTAQSLLVPFAVDTLEYLTAYNDFDFSVLRKQKTAIYLKTPATEGAHNTIMAMFYSQLFKYLLNTPVEPQDQSIVVMMEEFGNLPKIMDFTTVLSMIRSKRVSVNIILQSIAQLDSTYSKETTDIILGNTASLLVYGGLKESRSLDYVKDLAGKSTRQISQAGGDPQLIARDLMTTQEIRSLKKHQALFFHGRNPVQKLFTLPVFKNPMLMRDAGLYSEAGQLYASHPPLLTEQLAKHPPLDFLDLQPPTDETKQARTVVQQQLNDLIGP